jgi:hypothetical protein
VTILDHLRAVLATVNDKAHATPETQEVIERARRALAEADAGRYRVVDVDVVNGVLTMVSEPRYVADVDRENVALAEPDALDDMWRGAPGSLAPVFDHPLTPLGHVAAGGWSDEVAAAHASMKPDPVEWGTAETAPVDLVGVAAFVPVADQRAAFVAAMDDADQRGDR